MATVSSNAVTRSAMRCISDWKNCTARKIGLCIQLNGRDARDVDAVVLASVSRIRVAAYASKESTEGKTIVVEDESVELSTSWAEERAGAREIVKIRLKSRVEVIAMNLM